MSNTLDFPNDDNALVVFGSRIATARLNRNLTQAALAEEAGVSRNTVVRLETGTSVELKLVIRILRALDLLEGFLAGLPADEPSPMALLETRGRKRQRARGRHFPERI